MCGQRAGLTFTPDEAIAGRWDLVWDLCQRRSKGITSAGQQRASMNLCSDQWLFMSSVERFELHARSSSLRGNFYP